MKKILTVLAILLFNSIAFSQPIVDKNSLGIKPPEREDIIKGNSYTTDFTKVGHKKEKADIVETFNNFYKFEIPSVINGSKIAPSVISTLNSNFADELVTFSYNFDPIYYIRYCNAKKAINNIKDDCTRIQAKLRNQINNSALTMGLDGSLGASSKVTNIKDLFLGDVDYSYGARISIAPKFLDSQWFIKSKKYEIKDRYYIDSTAVKLVVDTLLNKGEIEVKYRYYIDSTAVKQKKDTICVDANIITTQRKFWFNFYYKAKHSNYLFLYPNSNSPQVATGRNFYEAFGSINGYYFSKFRGYRLMNFIWGAGLGSASYDNYGRLDEYKVNTISPDSISTNPVISREKKGVLGSEYRYGRGFAGYFEIYKHIYTSPKIKLYWGIQLRYFKNNYTNAEVVSNSKEIVNLSNGLYINLKDKDSKDVFNVAVIADNRDFLNNKISLANTKFQVRASLPLGFFY